MAQGNVDHKCPRAPRPARTQLTMRRLDACALEAGVTGHEFAIMVAAKKGVQQLAGERIGQEPRVIEGSQQFGKNPPAAVALPEYGLRLSGHLVPGVTMAARDTI